MSHQADMDDLERRLTRSLHAAAPPPAPDFVDRVLRQTVAARQRSGWILGSLPVLLAAVVLVLAVVTGLGIANLLPIEPNVGDDATPPAATASPTEAASTATPEPTVSSAMPSASASADGTAGWPRCENAELGFSVSYPADWWVQEPARPDPALDPLPGCTYFAPEPVDILQNAGLPPTVAIVFGLAEEPLGNPEQPIRVISSRELGVAGRPATVVEEEWTEDTVFHSAGERAYGYRISLPNGEVLVAGVGSAGGDYEEEKRALDQMMETLELLEP